MNQGKRTVLFAPVISFLLIVLFETIHQRNKKKGVNLPRSIRHTAAFEQIQEFGLDEEGEISLFIHFSDVVFWYLVK